MRQLIISILVSLMVFGLAIDNANAARFGGGRSMGSYSRSMSTPHRTADRPTGTTQRPARSHGHFLSGLVAGGLLGALFFGGGFHGFKFLDFLLILIIAFVIFTLLKKRKAGMQHQSANQYRTSNQGNQSPAFGGASSYAGSTAGRTPDWFNQERFLNDAKQHFNRIQKAWDDNNLPEIQDYVTPALYNVLKVERANQPANNKTDVVRLFAEMGSIQEIGQQAEASVLFHGVLIENGQQTEFNEVWHLVRELRDQAPWYIQGIEQRS